MTEDRQADRQTPNAICQSLRRYADIAGWDRLGTRNAAGLLIAWICTYGAAPWGARCRHLHYFWT